MNNRGFTLIEILVAMTIFMTMMGLIGNVFYRTNKITRKSLSVLEMFQRAEGVNRLISADFEYLLSTCAMQIDTDQDLKQITFMSSLVHDPDKDGSFYTFENDRNTGLTWIRWEWDNTNGIVRRASSRKSLHRTTQQLDRGNISRGRLHYNNVLPTAQQHFVYFDGDSKSSIGTGMTNSRKSRHHIYKEVIEVAANNTMWYTDFRFRNEYQNYYLGTLAIVGDNTAKISPDVYAVRNPDGLTFNKDKANLVGAANNDEYPTQLADVTVNIEFFNIELLKQDASTAITNADDDDTIDDGHASIDISGVELSGRFTGQHSKRPAFANVSYLLHDLPLDILGENSDDPLIVELRQRVMNDTTLNDSDPLVELNNQREALLNLIEEFGFNAIIVYRSARLPL